MILYNGLLYAGEIVMLPFFGGRMENSGRQEMSGRREMPTCGPKVGQESKGVRERSKGQETYVSIDPDGEKVHVDRG